MDEQKRQTLIGTEKGQVGISNAEYNSQLKGRSGFKVYEEMRRSDAKVKASLKIIKLPIQSISWDVEAGGDDKKDEEIRDFVRENVMNRIDFRQFLSEALTMLDFGFSVFEIVLDSEDGKLVLDKLATRKQTSILKWETEEGEDGILQTIGGERTSVPMEKLLVFTHEKEGDNREGISVLRSAYKHWYIKDKLYRIDAISHERQGMGIPKAIEPEGGATDKERDKVEEILRNLRTNEEAYQLLPKGWDLEIMDMGAGGSRDAIKSIEHHDNLIFKNTLSQFLDIGSESSGARAASIDQREMFVQAEESIARTISGTMQKLIKILVDLNFSGAKNYPKLTFGQIGQENVTQMGEVMKKLADANMLTPDPDMEQHVREQLRLPDLPEEIADDYENRTPALSQRNENEELNANLKAARAMMDEDEYGSPY